MARIDADGVPVALQPLVEVLVGKVLVPAERVRVRQRGVQLQRTQEEAQRRLMLLQAAGCKAFRFCGLGLTAKASSSAGDGT